MPVHAERVFVRQRRVDTTHVGIVVPAQALMAKVSDLGLATPSASAPPLSYTFHFHYLDHAVVENLLTDEGLVDTQLVQFPLREGVVGVFDLARFEDEEFSWSFSSTCWVDVVVALRVGETLDVVFEQPLEAAYHVSKSHFPPIGVPDSGYGGYPVHVTVDRLRPTGFRVVSSFERSGPRTTSRLPFLFGFRVFGRADGDERYPVWRERLGDAIRQALHGRWEQALLYAAFSLESFIDMLLTDALSRAGLSDGYIEHVLKVGGRREELLGLNKLRRGLTDKEINRLSEDLSQAVFGPRNKLAHGDTGGLMSAEDAVRAIKAVVAFVWDWDAYSRRFLLPILPKGSPDSLVDEQLIEACSTESVSPPGG